MSNLSIPEIVEDYGVASAALRYANAGFYVGPLLHRSKNPGAILGDGWQHKTSRDKDQIMTWFSEPTCDGVFIHVGRSGAVIFDVDYPENVPEILADFIWERDADGNIIRAKVPFQCTRPNNPWRGHYIARMPPGRLIGNSLGGLRAEKGWGEVRGYNGVIVASPSEHERDDGFYKWISIGALPEIPRETADKLTDAGSIDDSATDEQVAKFMREHGSVTRAALMKAPVEQFVKKVAAGESRHESMVSVACMAMREAAMGFYAASGIANELYAEFRKALRGTPLRWPKNEFKSIISYAVGQALGVDAEQRRAEALERLRQRDEARKEAAPAPMGQGEIPTDPQKYFLDKSVGLDSALIANDVIKLGPVGQSADGMTWAYRNGVWLPDKSVIRDRVVHLLGSRYRASHTRTISDIVESRAVNIDAEPHADFWNCRNGMLNWKTGELIPHSPDFRSTVQFEFDWEPDAKCPRFEEFIDEILTPDYATLLWQMFSYALFSGNPLQTAFMMHGDGSNGKSVVLKVLQHMLGENSYSAMSLTSLNKNKFAMINLFGKIANIMSDIDGKFQEDTSMFRILTGGDIVPAERKFGDVINFQCWALPIFSANKFSGVGDPGKHYFRRWQVIVYEKTFSGDAVILELERRFYPEVSGIAARCLPILRDLMASRQFHSGGDVAAGKRRFEQAADQVRQWIDECTVPHSENNEVRSVLYRSYVAWAQENRFGILKSTEFYDRLTSAGYPPKKTRGVRCHSGIRVLDLRMRGAAADEIRDSWERV